MLHGPVIAVDIVTLYLMGSSGCTDQKTLIKTHVFTPLLHYLLLFYRN